MELVSRLTRQSAAAETSGHLTHGPGNTLFRFYVCRELGQTTSYLNFKELNRFLSKRVPMLKRSLPYAGRRAKPFNSQTDTISSPSKPTALDGASIEVEGESLFE